MQIFHILGLNTWEHRSGRWVRYQTPVSVQTAMPEAWMSLRLKEQVFEEILKNIPRKPCN